MADTCPVCAAAPTRRGEFLYVRRDGSRAVLCGRDRCSHRYQFDGAYPVAVGSRRSGGHEKSTASDSRVGESATGSSSDRGREAPGRGSDLLVSAAPAILVAGSKGMGFPASGEAPRPEPSIFDLCEA
jgi:hypothetical protein